MGTITIPKGYKSELNLHDTQLAIKTVKGFLSGTVWRRRLHLDTCFCTTFCRSGIRI